MKTHFRFIKTKSRSTTDEDSIVLPNDNGIEVGTEKSMKIGLPKAQNLPMKDSRLNQFKDNDQSFVHQSPAGTVQMKPSRLPEKWKSDKLFLTIYLKVVRQGMSVQNVVTREAAPKPIQNVHIRLQTSKCGIYCTNKNKCNKRN